MCIRDRINYLDWESSSIQSRRCYETAVKHGKKVIVMEPVTVSYTHLDVYKRQDKHYFTNDYLPKMHRIGKITGILGVFAS